VAAVVSLLVVVDPKSATRYVCMYDCFETSTDTFCSAPRSATLLVTALRLVAMVVVAVASVATKEDTAAAVVVSADVKVDRPATLAVATDTCQETVLRAKSATTAAKLDI